MALDSVSQLGEKLGKQSNEQETIKQNISPNDPVAQFPQFEVETVILQQCYTITKKNQLTDSFVLDHPTLGELDSATLKLDGGYGEDDIFYSNCTTGIAVSPSTLTMNYSIKSPSVNISTPGTGGISDHSTLPTSLEAYYTLDDTYNDELGNHNGTNNGSSFATGKIDNGATFDGVNDWISLGAINLNSSFSVSAWVANTRPNTPDESYFLGQGGNGPANESLHMGMNASGYFNFDFYANGLVSTDLMATDGTFEHWVGTYNASTNSQKLYKDGVLHTSRTATADYVGTETVALGRRYGTTGYDWFKGELDEVGIWTKELTSTEVSDLYNSGSGLPYTGTASGVTVTPGVLDLTSSVKTPTITGTGTGGSTITGHASLETNLETYWALDNDFTDDIGSLDLTANGGLTAAATGIVDGCSDFDGTDDYASRAAASAINDIWDGGGSVSFWINTATGLPSAGNHSLLEKGNWRLRLTNFSGNLAFIYFWTNWSTSNGTWLSATRHTVAGTWAHIAITYDSSSTSNDAKLYVNGSEVTFNKGGYPLGTYTSDSSETLQIGRTLTTYYYEGRMDEIGMWSKILTSGEVSDLYNSGNGLPYN